MQAMKIVYGVVGLLVAVYVMQAVLPLLFALDFSNSSIWGTFGASILPTVFPLVLAAGVLFLIIAGITTMVKKKGKGGYGL